MNSKHSHARTQSALPSLNPMSRTHRSPGRLQTQRHVRSGCADSVDAFDNESHNLADYDYGVRLVDLARNPHEDLHLAEPPRAASPARPALGARLLSSLSSAQPAAVALTRKGSVLHSRAKSLAAFVPKLNTTTTTAPPSERSSHTSNKLFGDLFHGESAPIRLGPPQSPTKEKEETDVVMDYISAFTERPSAPRRRETAPQPTSSNISHTSRSTSWFTRKPTNPLSSAASRQQQQQQQQAPPDELASINVHSALFPHGPPDPLDPTAFNNLLLNATNLLQRMQAAYREKVDYIASMRPEQEAARDEVEEAETRATHLKKQLEDMSRRAQEQETTMKEMARELAEEKMKTLEAREAARTIRCVGASDVVATVEDERQQCFSTVRRKKRGSSSDGSDSGFESDLDSIFSSYSVPPDTPLSPGCVSRAASFESRISQNAPQPTVREVPQHAKVAMKTVGANGAVQRLGREGAAWATVEALRSENKELRQHVQELHDTLQGCIEFVSGMTE